MVNKIIVAIDGYSSCGKSTIAKALAKHAGYTYVDTGAMYRAVALYAIRTNIHPATSNIQHLLKDIHIGFTQTDNGQHVTLNGEDVETYIRTLEVGTKIYHQRGAHILSRSTTAYGHTKRHRNGRTRYWHGGFSSS